MGNCQKDVSEIFFREKIGRAKSKCSRKMGCKACSPTVSSTRMSTMLLQPCPSPVLLWLQMNLWILQQGRKKPLSLLGPLHSPPRSVHVGSSQGLHSHFPQLRDLCLSQDRPSVPKSWELHCPLGSGFHGAQVPLGALGPVELLPVWAMAHWVLVPRPELCGHLALAPAYNLP